MQQYHPHSSLVSVLAGLFQRYVPAILEMLKRGKLEPLVPIPTISMVQVRYTSRIIPLL